MPVYQMRDGNGLETHLTRVLHLHHQSRNSCMSLVDHMTVYFDRMGVEFKYTSIPVFRTAAEDNASDSSESVKLPGIMVMIELKSAYGTLTQLLNPDNYTYMFKPLLSVQEIIEREMLSIQFNYTSSRDEPWLASYPISIGELTSASGHGRNLEQAVRCAVLNGALAINEKHRIKFKKDDTLEPTLEVDAGPDSE